MESHFCRAKKSKLYLHPDLSLSKMYHFFVNELKKQGKNKEVSSYATYNEFLKNNIYLSVIPKRTNALRLTKVMKPSKQNWKIYTILTLERKYLFEQRRQWVNLKPKKIMFCVQFLIFNKWYTSQYQKIVPYSTKTVYLHLILHLWYRK